MKRRLAFVGVGALVASAGLAHGQLILGLDSTAEALREYKPLDGTFTDIGSLGLGVRALAANDAARLYYFSTGSSLYRVSYDSLGAPELVANFSGAVTTISGGLGYVPSEGLLYGCTTSNSNLIAIDPATAVTTLVRNLGGGDWGGLDFNAGDGKLYLTNDSTSTTAGLTGRGIYTIEAPYATGTFVELVDYPNATEGDIDGLAVGGGKVWACKDLNNNAMWELDIATLTWSAQITRPGGTTTSRVFNGATYAPSLAVLPPGANIGVAASGDAPCTVAINGTATFTFTVNNIGPDPATGVSIAIDLPANADMFSSVPAGTIVGSTLTVNLGGIAASGSSPVTVTMRPTSGSSLTASAVVSATSPDAVPGNNSAMRVTSLAPNAPTALPIKGIVSTIASSDSSLVPGLGGARFATGVLAGMPAPSPDRSRFLQTWDTDLATTTDAVILQSVNGTLSVIVQEGVTVMPSGATPEGSFDALYDVNNAGQYVFAGGDNGPTATDGYVVKWDGTQYVDVAREGTPAPAATGAINYGTTAGAARIAANGSVAFVHSVTGLTTTTDTFVFKDDGATIVAQESVTIPTGQFNPGFSYKAFDATGPATGVFFNADHSRYLIAGTVNDATSLDRIAAVDGDVKIQENVVLPGSSFGSPADTPTPIGAARMESNGDWLAYGSNDDGQDWVVRNGTVIAQTNAPITTTSTETYDQTPFSTTFYFALGNPRGDYVIGGTTNSTDPLANAVLVLNGTTVIARENDPIDLDNDGVFDDDAYLRTFVDDRGFLANDAAYIVVRIRNGNAAFCGGTDTDLGVALIRIPLPATCIADFNNSGTVTVQDIFDFLAAYFSGSTSADVNDSGTVTVQDIFDFLAAYFIGCP